jgi:hypothetical protein
LGKSSGIKTCAVLRQLILGRRVLLIDKKYQPDHPGPADRCPPPRGQPLRTALSTPAGQSILVLAVVDEALGRPLLPKEGKDVRMAHKQALRAAAVSGEIADFRHVLTALYSPDKDTAEASHLTVEELRQWGQDPAFELERMTEDDLAGVIDGPTSEEISLNAGLTVFDVSLLPEDGRALAIRHDDQGWSLASPSYRQLPSPRLYDQRIPGP